MVTITGITPTEGTGLGPHTLTVEGTEFPTTPGACQIVLKDAGGATVGQSNPGTAAVPEAFTAAVRFEIFTPSGAYNVCLAVSGILSQSAVQFTLTRNAPTIPPEGGGGEVTSEGFGQWVPGNFPANRPKSGGRPMGRR